MKTILPYVVESFVFLGILLVSYLAARPFVIRSRINKLQYVKHKRWAAGLLAHTAWPLAVLIISVALWMLVGLLPGETNEWLAGRGAHYQAWMVFWIFTLLLRLLEGALVCSFWAKGKPFPVPSLLISMVRVALILLGAFIILKEIMGVNIAPLLASTALLTAVVGFALQGVLGNLLSGMSLHLVRTLDAGDWIEIQGIEGEVIETNWRETRLRTRNGHIMVVPNSVVSGAIINNMTWPDALRRHRLNVGASYSDAPGEVIAELVEAAKSVPQVLADPPPEAFVTEYKDFGINYVLRYWTTCYSDRTPIDGEVNRMIWYRFKRKGIEIPFPMSDQLLNDFMAVVYRQRSEPPEDRAVERMANELFNSDFARILLLDPDQKPLLNRDELAELARLSTRVYFTRGETLFRQGDAGHCCYVLVSGKLHAVFHDHQAGRMHDIELNAGALVGEMSLLTGLPRTATISAAEECVLIEINEQAFAHLLGLKKEIPERLATLAEERANAIRAEFQRLQQTQPSMQGRALTKRSFLERLLGMMGAERP